MIARGVRRAMIARGVRGAMIARGVHVALTLMACGAVWYGYGMLGLLRRTPLWEFRYVLGIVAVFLGLTVLDWLARRIAALLDPGDDPH